MFHVNGGFLQYAIFDVREIISWAVDPFDDLYATFCSIYSLESRQFSVSDSVCCSVLPCVILTLGAYARVTVVRRSFCLSVIELAATYLDYTLKFGCH